MDRAGTDLGTDPGPAGVAPAGGPKRAVDGDGGPAVYSHS